MGYGCTTCIGNSGPLDGRVAKAIEEQRARRRGRALGQPQLRGPHPSAGPGLVPRVAATRRGLRAGRHGRHRPARPAAGPRTATASRSTWPTSGRRPKRSATRSPRPSRRRCSGASTRASSTATSAGARCPCRSAAAATPGTRTRPTSRGRRSSMASRASPRRSRTSSARASSRSWATPSRPTTSRPPARSRPGQPAGQWLQEHGVAPLEFNSYGARRGQHEVMMRGTFGNIRLRNALADKEGPYTTHQPSGERDVHLRRRDALPARGRAAGHLLAGKEYGSRLVARLGGQGHDAARRPRRARRELRAHPPLQPGRHGRPAAPVPARPERRSRSA